MRICLSLRERFYALFEPEPNSGCWLWVGVLDGLDGYGKINVKCDNDGRWRPRFGHRVSYQLHVGPIPEALDLDHLCRVKCCVNPDHLEPVTRSENLRRRPLFADYQRAAARSRWTAWRQARIELVEQREGA